MTTEFSTTARGKSQIRRIRKDGLTPARRTLFLETLARTDNVTMAAEAAGCSAQAFYKLRDRDPDFLRQWEEAVAIGYEEIELNLLAKGRGLPVPDGFDPAVAVAVLKRRDAIAAYQERRRKRGAPAGREMPATEMRRELLRRLAVIVAAPDK